MQETLTITSALTGVEFRVRIVLKGEKYGREMCLTHDKDDPYLEFYDTRFDNEKFDLGLGQFVTRYNLTTLLGLGKWGSPVNRCGLDLQGDVAAWKVDGESMDQVLCWAVKTLAARASENSVVAGDKKVISEKGKRSHP